MVREPAPRDSGWIGDLRRDPRWKEGLLATMRFRGDEWPAITGDLSLGGAKIALHSAVPFVGEPVALAIAFEKQILEVRGVVQNVQEKPWGSIVGIQFEENAHTHLARRCLARTRTPPAREAGSLASGAPVVGPGVEMGGDETPVIASVDVRTNRYFRFTVEGPIDGAGLFESCLRVGALFGTKGPRKLFVDVRRVEWCAPTTELPHVAPTMGHPAGIRIALLCRPDDPDARFLETVAASHGVALQRFHDEAEALAAVEL